MIQLSPPTVAQRFQPLVGQPAYLVRHGYGSFLSLEFGQPQLTVYPTRPRRHRADELSPLKRPVVVHGQWHLRITCCHWQVWQDQHLISHCESNRAAMADTISVLNGQILQSVSLTQGTAKTQFDFDLGAQLITIPYGEDREAGQWLLHSPDGFVFALRADAHFSLQHQEDCHAPQWQSLW